MKAHERSSLHTQASQALLVISKQGSVVQQLQRVGMQEREKDRAAMKSLVRGTHFLTRHHIAHFTNFTQLVDLIVSWETREFQVFVEIASRNAVYAPGEAVVTLSMHLEHGRRSLFLKIFKRHQFLLSWQMSALISRQWKNCQFSVLGRKMAHLSNAFWTLCL